MPYIAIAAPRMPCAKPAEMEIFTDHGSVGHVALGALAAIAPPPWNLATFALFSGYEVSKLQTGESASRTGGKFVEFGLGLIGVGLAMAFGGGM